MQRARKSARDMGFAARARWAVESLWMAGRPDATQERFAAALARELEAMGRPDLAVSQSQISRWFAGQRADPWQLVAASRLISRIAGVEVDPGWLEFGGESLAPAPPNVPAHVAALSGRSARYLSEERIAAGVRSGALRPAERPPAPNAATRRRRGRGAT